MAKAKIVWRERAFKDIDRLYDFLFEKSEDAAAKAAQAILRGSSLLEESPRLVVPWQMVRKDVSYLSLSELVITHYTTF